MKVVAWRKNKTASEIIRALNTIFARNGIPEMVSSDNGPPNYSQEYNKNTAISQDNGVFRFHQVAPSMPSQMVKQRELYMTVKNILKKGKDKEIALLTYRSTPLSSRYSPAKLLMGRRLL